MSGDIGDLGDGLLDLLDISPSRWNSSRPLWRRVCSFIWRLVWCVLFLVMSVALIVAVVSWALE